MFDLTLTELRRRCAGDCPEFSTGVGKEQDCGQRLYRRPVTLCISVCV